MYVWIVRVLLLEHSYVLWYRRLPFTSSNQYYYRYTRYRCVSSAIWNSSILEGRKVAQQWACTVWSYFYCLLIITRASLLDVLIYFNLIYFLVISIHLRSAGHLSDYAASALLSDKLNMADTCQQTMLLLPDAVNAEKNTSLKMSICQRFYD